ncbi:FtsX-like permease family protein [Glaciibacter flavus]|uniref:FtsX-like permease family protein n=1 Tax=Orlajensenia flava TaxID=2565934 RepID=UPI003B001EF0
MARRSTSTGSLLGRHLAAHPAGAVTLAVLVIVLSAVATAAPRAVAAMDSSAVQQQLSALTLAQRDLVSSVVGVPEKGGSASPRLEPASDAVWGQFDDAVRRMRAEYPQPLRSSTGEPDYLLAVDPLDVTYLGTGHHTRISLGFDPRSEHHVRYVEGTAPGVYTGDVLDVALDSANADALEWAVGQTRTFSQGTGTVTMRLTGLFAPRHGTDDYFSHAPLLLRPSIEQQGLGPPIYTGTALVDPSAVEFIGTLPVAPRLQIWFPLDVSTVTADSGDELLTQLREVERTPPTISIVRPGFWGSDVTFRAPAADALEQALGARAASDAVIVVMAAGPFGVMIAVLALGCRVVARRRADALRLLGARGVSPAGRASLLALEGVVIALPAGVLGSVIGLSVTPGGWSAGLIVVPLAFAAITALLLTTSLRATEGTARADLSPAAGDRWRIALELTVVVLAILGTLALLQRGVSGGIDPLLVAVPLLLAGAACVIALRLYPLPLQALADRARGRAGLGGFLGPSRALRDRAIGLAPVFALLVGTAVAVSSGVLLTSVQNGVTAAAQTAVGADMRVSGTGVGADQLRRIAAIPGVAETAAASGNIDGIIDNDGRRTNIAVVWVDPGELAQVQRGSAGAIPVDGLDGGSQGGIPVLVSPSVASAMAGSSSTRVNGEKVRVVGTVAAPNALTDRSGVVVVAQRNADALADAEADPRTILLRLEPGARIPDVSRAVTAVTGTDATVESAKAAAAERAALPVAAGLQAALTAAIALSGVLGGITLVMTLVLGAPARARTVTLLRMLGARRGEERALVAWELGPPVVAAVVVGVALGIALPIVVLSGVDLRAFTGGSIQPALSIDPVATSVLVIGFLAATALFTAVALVASRTARASSILRSVPEG